ncbi:MAG: alanine racemase, partial [Clostridiales bacterium]|nr:alanine racemase [Clostridiales bacterium]
MTSGSERRAGRGEAGRGEGAPGWRGRGRAGRVAAGGGRRGAGGAGRMAAGSGHSESGAVRGETGGCAALARQPDLRQIRPAWAEIDLDALAHNIGETRRLVGPSVLICAAVKADAYGHGAAMAARALLGHGADRLCVATLDEGVELRGSGIAAPILIMGAMERHRAAQIVSSGLAQAVSSFAEARLLSDEARRQ